MAADAQAIFAVPTLELFHVTGEIGLQLVEPESDVAPQLFWHSTKRCDGFVAKFNSVAHPHMFGERRAGGQGGLRITAQTVWKKRARLASANVRGNLRAMQTLAFNYWQDGDAWLGYLDEFPDYRTQGESLDDLKAHLRDLHADLTSGEIPCVRHRAEMEVA